MIDDRIVQRVVISDPEEILIQGPELRDCGVAFYNQQRKKQEYTLTNISCAWTRYIHLLIILLAQSDAQSNPPANIITSIRVSAFMSYSDTSIRCEKVYVPLSLHILVNWPPLKPL